MHRNDNAKKHLFPVEVVGGGGGAALALAGCGGRGQQWARALQLAMRARLTLRALAPTGIQHARAAPALGPARGQHRTPQLRLLLQSHLKQVALQHQLLQLL